MKNISYSLLCLFCFLSLCASAGASNSFAGHTHIVYAQRSETEFVFTGKGSGVSTSNETNCKQKSILNTDSLKNNSKLLPAAYSYDPTFVPQYNWVGYTSEPEIIFPYQPASIVSIIEDDEGNIFVGGYYNIINADSFVRANICKVKHNGDIDLGFAYHGTPTFGCKRLYLHKDTLYGIYTYNLKRFNAITGEFDWDFYNAFNDEILNGQITDICLFENGSMFLAVDGTYHYGTPEMYNFWLGVLKPDASLDTTFHHTPNYFVHNITRYDENRYLLDGTFTQYDTLNVYKLCRIYTDGTLDTTFHNIFSWGYTKPLYIQTDGRILIGGFFTLFGSNDWMMLVRLMPDGRLDSTFNNYNNAYTVDSNRMAVRTIVPTPDEHLMIGGYFTHYQGYIRNSLVLTDSNGFIDTTKLNGEGCIFINDSIQTANVSCIIPAQNDKYYMGGTFNYYNGHPVQSIVRIFGSSWGNLGREEKSVQSLSLYPNPAKNNLRVLLAENLQSGQIEVFNLNGQKLFSKEFKNQRDINLDVSALAPGTYILQATNGEEVFSEKFVIVK